MAAAATAAPKKIAKAKNADEAAAAVAATPVTTRYKVTADGAVVNVKGSGGAGIIEKDEAQMMECWQSLAGALWSEVDVANRDTLGKQTMADASALAALLKKPNGTSPCPRNTREFLQVVRGFAHGDIGSGPAAKNAADIMEILKNHFDRIFDPRVVEAPPEKKSDLQRAEAKAKEAKRIEDLGKGVAPADGIFPGHLEPFMYDGIMKMATVPVKSPAGYNDEGKVVYKLIKDVKLRVITASADAAARRAIAVLAFILDGHALPKEVGVVTKTFDAKLEGASRSVTKTSVMALTGGMFYVNQCVPANVILKDVEAGFPCFGMEYNMHRNATIGSARHGPSTALMLFQWAVSGHGLGFKMPMPSAATAHWNAAHRKSPIALKDLAKRVLAATKTQTGDAEAKKKFFWQTIAADLLQMAY